MAKFTPVDLQSGFASTASLNSNFDQLETLSDQWLSRDGTTPNAMNSDLDMNGSDIINADVIQANTFTDLAGDGIVLNGLNTGLGDEGVFKQKTTSNLIFRDLTAGTNITFTNTDTDQITINASSSIGAAANLITYDDSITQTGQTDLQATTEFLIGNMDNKNYLINPNFDIWERGTSFPLTTSLSYTADRWKAAEGSTGTAIITREGFTPGQTDVPNEPEFFLRFDQTVGSSDQPSLRQSIEGVRSLAGKSATLTFFAKGSSNFTLGTLLAQNYGATGSVTTTSNSDGAAVTTSWQKFQMDLVVPSVTGKTISGGGDYLEVLFTLPISTIVTFDLAQVQIEDGASATSFEYRPRSSEEIRCQRYYVAPPIVGSAGPILWNSESVSGQSYTAKAEFPVVMRAAPTVTLIDGGAPSGFPTTPGAIASVTRLGFREARAANSSLINGFYSSSYTADAEL